MHTDGTTRDHRSWVTPMHKLSNGIFANSIFLKTCRNIGSSHTLLSDNLKLKLKGRKKSSQEWLLRQMADPYMRWARVEQYRCRSAFKLLEMDEKHRFLRPGMCVVDCGAAPGSWTQVLVKKCITKDEANGILNGMVIAVDLSDIVPIEHATIFEKHDFTASETQEKIKVLLEQQGGAHAVLSDMAPSATGVKHLDHEAIVHLAYKALRFSVTVSQPGAVFLIKLWNGGLTSKFQTDIEKFYSKVKILKPNASRSDSAEIYLFAKEFKGLKAR